MSDQPQGPLSHRHPRLLRCVVVDDHQLVAQAVGGLLSELCGLSLEAVCGSVREALPVFQASRPDLLILDLCLPEERWQDAVEPFLACNPAGALIILSGHSAEFVPPEHLDAHLLAVVDKGRAWHDLVDVITSWRHQRNMASPARLPLDTLTPRELRVFLSLGRGLLNKEIASELCLSVQTVETYRKNLGHKLGISGAELVRAASLHRCVTAPV